MTKLSAVAWTTPRYSSHMNAQRKKMLMIAPQMCFPTHLLILRLLSTPSRCCVVQPGTRNMRHNAFHGRWKGPRVPALWNTQGTPTYTHRFPVRQGFSWTSLPLSFSFHFVRPNPSTRHRITRAARVRAPSAENRSYVQKFSVSPSSCVPPMFPHTHVLPFSLFALQTDSPYTCVRRRLCVFSISLSQDNGASELLTLRPASSDLLPFVSPSLP